MKYPAMEVSIIQNKIYEARGQRVMLDFDLSALYGVETKVLNQAVKRNLARFPADFMFRLNKKEWESLRSQIVTLEKGKGQHSKYLPFAFTEHGVTMLASVLKSPKAVKMNISIVRAFIALRQISSKYKELIDQIEDLKTTVGSHSTQLNQIYDALENLLEEKTEQKTWEQREPIGFKQQKK
jgi:phage regulator Rha-like protein